MKRFLAIFMSVCLMLSLAMPTMAARVKDIQAERQAKTVTLESVADFLEFAEKCRLDSYSRELQVELKADINLTGYDFVGIPIFCGTFLGNDYTVSGLNLTQDGSYQGLFRYLADTAVVRQLHVRGNVSPGGSRTAVGGIVGQNSGRVEQCSFTGTVNGAEQVGGIAGVNTVTGIIENCVTSGTLTGSHLAGGIAGVNAGVIRHCENESKINTTPQQNQVELADITMDTLTQTEAAITVTDVGGIAGTSTGFIRNCVNEGTVGYRYMGYNIGGIAGSQAGTILDCENRGDVWGRKEVGGIVGHLEPAAMVEFDEDALQILRKQLDAIGGTVNQTSANVQTSALALTGQVSLMSSAVQDAWSAVSILIPGGDGSAPDQDAIEAARNGLSDSLWNMTSALEGMSYVTMNTTSALSANLGTLQQQVGAMSATLGNVSETVGGTIEDVSDLDTEVDLSGKVAGCVNRAAVDGEVNVGGIAGAMALESDLESATHLEVLGERSINFTSQIRSVIRNCENMGIITITKQNAGGIVGFQTVGLIRASETSGSVGGDMAEYVGGIAGRSNGYIRESHAKGVLAGKSWVGGIAGSATIVTDCLAMVEFSGPEERFGAILGISEAPPVEVEDPIAENYYAIRAGDPGGIDGISYEGMAAGMELSDFLARLGLPQLFRKVTLTFLSEDGRVWTRILKPGESLRENQIPPVPEVEGYEGYWEGLTQENITNVAFDRTFRAAYTLRDAAIASGEAQGEVPVLLVQGSFSSDAVVDAEISQQTPPLPEGYQLADCWDITIGGENQVTEGRILIPDEEMDNWHILVQLPDGIWQEREAVENGRHLVFAMDGTETAIAVAGSEDPVWPIYAAGAGVLVLAAVLILLLKKRKR